MLEKNNFHFVKYNTKELLFKLSEIVDGIRNLTKKKLLKMDLEMRFDHSKGNSTKYLLNMASNLILKYLYIKIYIAIDM